MEVLLVAAKRELVDNKVSLLQDAGLTPRLIDVDAFALHNAFERNYPEAMDGIVALVNIGHEMTNVNILENGVPILTRDIPFGSRRSGRTCSGSGAHGGAGRGRRAGPGASDDLERFVESAPTRWPWGWSGRPRSS
jgi:hypothetical protein